MAALLQPMRTGLTRRHYSDVSELQPTELLCSVITVCVRFSQSFGESLRFY